MARSSNITTLLWSLSTEPGQPVVSTPLTGVSTEWKKFTGAIEVDDAVPADAMIKFSLAAQQAGQFVVQHIFLQPSDNIHGSDPDIIRGNKLEMNLKPYGIVRLRIPEKH